jgi:hypothetical protein
MKHLTVFKAKRRSRPKGAFCSRLPNARGVSPCEKSPKKRQNSQNYYRAKSDVFEGFSPKKTAQAAVKWAAP